VSVYNAQRYALNVTRRDMVEAGWSPSVRLFEAAACGTPVVSDVWDGLETVFTPGDEILLASTADEALAIVRALPEEERLAIGAAARARVLKEHTAAHRARQLEGLIT
jgi:spore maturation protein CgeB